MHPAVSIIVFTVSSGLGYGLAAMLGLGLLDPAATATKVAYLLALVLIAGGLLSSTLHLGNPQRAWRALSQWRTSWLSREGVMAFVTFVPLCISAYAAIFDSRHLVISGLAGTVLAGVTVYCTAMIYGSLRSVQAWHTPLTPLCFLLFSAAGGALLTTLFSALAGASTLLPGVLAVLLLVAAWTVKLAWRRRLNTERPRSTPETATGLGALGQVRQFERPHGNENYLTREMGFRVARKHAGKLFRIAFVAAGVVPLALVAAAIILPGEVGALAIAACLFAVLAHGAGMLVERWLFFAEARHAVMNYYEG